MSKADASWSRAFMASSGVQISNSDQARPRSAEWHEAQAETLSPERIQKLAMHKDPEVREVIASRVNCPLGVLISLAHDRRADIRVAVAGNPRVSPAVVEHLIRDRDIEVVKAVARNPRTPLALVEGLAFHKRPEVRRVATRVLDERNRAEQPTTDPTPRPVVRAPELEDGARGGLTGFSGISHVAP